MSEPNSHRQIIRSSSIIGGASVINIVISLIRTKVVAVLLGPTGVGLIGLLQNLMATAVTASALGFGNVGTRQIAEANSKGDLAAVAAARRALFWGTLTLALVGSTVFWLSRELIARHVIGDPLLADAVGWLAVGVGLSVAAGSQTALLTGMRRIGDIARLKIGSAIASTLFGLIAIWWLGERGLLLFLLVVPTANFVLGHFYAARLPRLHSASTPLPQLVRQWRTLVRLGSAFMVASLVVSMGHLLVRSLVQRELGPSALGQFQAAWVISMTYIGFVLGAMGTDYYPRLTAVINDKNAANRLINEQTEVALLLAGPVLLGMLALAPWVTRLLYSSEFNDTANILRWQVLGDVLKIASWPLGFVILAAGAGRTFILSETFGVGVFVSLVWLGLPVFGIQVTGVGFALMYCSYLPLVYWLARRRTGFAWKPQVRNHLALLLLVAVATCFVAQWREFPAVMFGLASMLGFGLYALHRLNHILEGNGRIGRVVEVLDRALKRFKFWR